MRTQNRAIVISLCNPNSTVFKLFAIQFEPCADDGIVLSGCRAACFGKLLWGNWAQWNNVGFLIKFRDVVTT